MDKRDAYAGADVAISKKGNDIYILAVTEPAQAELGFVGSTLLDGDLMEFISYMASLGYTIAIERDKGGWGRITPNRLQ